MGSGGSKSKDRVVNAATIVYNTEQRKVEPQIKVTESKNNNNDSAKPVGISEETLKEFLRYEKEIKKMRNKGVLADYNVKCMQKEQLDMDIIKAQANLKESEAKVVKMTLDYGTTNDIKEKLKEKGTKESNDCIDAINKQEIQSKEIVDMMAQKEKLEGDIKRLSEEGDLLVEYSNKQDMLLHTIFDGEYGSELENQLEKELVNIEEQKNYVEQAFYKWKKGQTCCLQAIRQFSTALEDWRSVKNTKSIDEKYALGTKTRNSLVAALQNMQGAHRLLHNITFPYCDKNELETLNEAITYIFTDMQTDERHEHASNCYDTIYRRAAALHQWMTQVINQAIVKDLESLTGTARKKETKLKEERVSLIIKVLQERGGSGKTFEFDNESLADEEAYGSGDTELFHADSSTPDDSTPVMPTPISSAELPPIPSRDAILGQVEDICKQHDQNKADFISAQDKNLHAVKMSLQEKLNARRRRRSNSIMNAREVQFLKTKA